MTLGTKWTPRKYQFEMVKTMVSKPAFGLLWDPGLGKTSVSLAAFKILKDKGIVKTMLVIAKRHIIHNTWPDEIADWSDFNHLSYEILQGTKKAKALTRSRPDIYLVNPEGLLWLERQRGFQWPDMLILDESTKFKHTNTQRFKIMRRIIPKFKRRYILTGTPTPNGLHDMFGQMFILDMGRSLGKFVTHYRSQYFHPAGFGGFGWDLNEGAAKKIYSKIAPITQRLDNETYLDLPNKIELDITVDMPETARKQYDRLCRDFLLTYQAGDVSALNAGVLTSKLRQIANGGVYLDVEPTDEAAGYKKNRRWQPMHDEKTIAAQEIVGELNGQPVMIAFEFKHDRERLLKAFPKAPVIDGSTSDKQSREILLAWNRGEVPVLLVHPSSAAHGLNMQKGGCHLIWYGMTYNLEWYIQLIARLWRSGQKHRVMVYRILARDTVDALQVKALAKKNINQQALFKAIIRYAEEREAA